MKGILAGKKRLNMEHVHEGKDVVFVHLSPLISLILLIISHFSLLSNNKYIFTLALSKSNNNKE